MEQVSLEALNSADRKIFMAAIGEVMELAPWVAEDTFARRPFASITAVYQAMTDAVRNAPPERRQALINGHPDLAGKAARKALTADSTAEQAAAGLDRLSEQELADFHRLNDAYRKKFAMPFIVCVRRHGKQSILREFARRLNNDAAANKNGARRNLPHRRAATRSARDGRRPPQSHGHLSTHVLDVHGGHPAQGVAIELCEIAGAGEARVIKRAATNADGRTDAPLFTGMPIPSRITCFAFSLPIILPMRARRWPSRRFSIL